MNLKILVCCHKDDIKVENDFYLPIHVGKNKSLNTLDILGDDTGNNISFKNESYCELTGIYWAWKNLKNVDYIGLCHYRRYFNFKNSNFSLPSQTISSKKFNKLSFNIPSDLKTKLDQGIIIVPKSESLKLSLYTDYCVWHYGEDLRRLEKIIKSMEDQSYTKAFDKVMYENNLLLPYNMFIMSWQEFDKYCSWLFPLLEKMESSVDISNYNPYQKRIFGFLAERLFNIYIEASKLRFEESQIIFVSDEKIKPQILPIYKIKRLINNLVSKYASPPKKLFINK